LNQDRTFQYSTGEVVLNGDSVKVQNKIGTVVGLFQPGTEQAKDYSCSDTGGVLIEFTDGDLQLWPVLDEDLILVKRQKRNHD